MHKNTLIVVVGPTAIGKTACAIQLAQHFHTEIISADSRQFFREMSIGTAKPSPEELQQAPHHLIGSQSIHELVSPGDFEQVALQILDKIFKRNSVAIAVGGSGLYVNALCHGLDELPDIDLAVRARLNEEFSTAGLDQIRARLKKHDPETYAVIDPENTQRVIRAVEFFESTGKKLSSFRTGLKKERPFNIIKIGLHVDRELLYQRINNRVDMMMKMGQLEEVRSLQPYKHLNALKTVGYTELFEHLDGHKTLDDAVALIKQNTRRFAKRQLTWFRKDFEIKWFDPLNTEAILEHIQYSLAVD